MVYTIDEGEKRGEYQARSTKGSKPANRRVEMATSIAMSRGMREAGEPRAMSVRRWNRRS